MSNQTEMPPVMILCGGKGTRLRDVSELLPKPMVPIGELPIIWHIMKCYAAFGVRKFILCLGYKREVFVDFFMNYHLRTSDATIQLGHSPQVTFHGEPEEADWQVTLAGTGLETMTGGRVARAFRYVDGDEFFLTYGDGVSNVDIAKELEFHNAHGKLATMTAVHPAAHFGVLELDKNQVNAFREKSEADVGWINGGFMILDPKVIDYIEDDSTVFERAPLEALASEGQLMAFKHRGFWQCMDTMRDKEGLEKLWASKRAPWKRWED